MLVGDHQPCGDTGLAQQPLETLMRGRLPSTKRATLIGIDARPFQPDKYLPRMLATRGIEDGPIGRKCRVILRKAQVKAVGQSGAAWSTRNHSRFPTEDRFRKGPWI